MNIDGMRANIWDSCFDKKKEAFVWQPAIVTRNVSHPFSRCNLFNCHALRTHSALFLICFQNCLQDTLSSNRRQRTVCSGTRRSRLCAKPWPKDKQSQRRYQNALYSQAGKPISMDDYITRLRNVARFQDHGWGSWRRQKVLEPTLVERDSLECERSASSGFPCARRFGIICQYWAQNFGRLSGDYAERPRPMTL